MTSLFKRAVLAIIALVILASALPVSQVLAYNTYDSHKDDLGWQAKSAWYYDAMYYCVSANQKVPTEKDYRLKFDSGDTQNGFIMRDTLSTVGDKGRTKCNDNDSELARKALAFWGIPELEFTCLFWKRKNGTPCNNGDAYGEFTKINSVDGKIVQPHEVFKNYIKDKVYGGQRDPITARNAPGAVKYIYFLESFKKGCAYNKSPQTTDPHAENGELVYWIGNVDDTGKIAPRWYIGTKSHNDKVGFYAHPNEDWKCYDIAKFISPEGEYTKAYAEWKKAHPAVKDDNSSGSGNTKDGDKPSSCGIGGIGWIVCPIIAEMAAQADKAVGFLQETFLEIDSKTFSSAPVKDENDNPKKDENGNVVYEPVYTAWMKIQQLANIAFAIAFIFIIYSQLTNQGISNYGVKKLLPRIIIAAILVNTSFILCQIAIDVSNVVGYNIMHLFDNLALPATEAEQQVAKATYVAVATAAIAGTAVSAILAWPLVAGAVLAAVVSLLFVWFILVARKALIVIIVIMAPLALVAYLLPNTEKWFTKWRQVFVSLLMLFPIVGLLFGASSMVSRILMQAASGEESLELELVAMTVAALPFFAVWPILKGSLDSVGKIGAKLNGLSDKYTGKSKAWATSAAAKSRLGKAQAFRAERNAKAVEMGRYKGLNPARRFASGKNRLMNRLAIGDYGRSARSEAAVYEQGLEATAATQLKNSNLTAEQMNQLTETNGKDKAFNKEMRKLGINAKDANTRTAAVGVAFAQNGDDANLAMIARTKDGGDRFKQAVAQAMTDNKFDSKVAGAGGDFVDKVRTDGADMNDIKAGTAAAIERGKFSVDGVPKQSPASLKLINDVLQNGYATTGKDGKEQKVTLSEQQADVFRKQAEQAISKEDVAHKVTSAQADEIRKIIRPPSRGGAAEGQDFNVHGK